MKKIFILFLLLIGLKISTSSAQEDFSRATFRFLEIPNTSRMQYLGKSSICSYDYDAQLAPSNPSLIHDEMRGKIMLSNNFYFQSNYVNISYFTANDKYEIPIMLGLNGLIYPLQQATDIDGTLLQKFNPIEMSAYAAGAKEWDNYRFGFGTKLVLGSYYQAFNMALAVDASCMYVDDERNIQVALLLKNMGFQMIGIGSSNYATPFDLQLGFSKKLSKLPFRFSVVAHSIYNWDNDNYSSDYGIWPLDPLYERNQTLVGRILNHFSFSGEFYLGQFFRMGFGYDLKRANELTFTEFYRGIPGVSLGCGIYSRKYEIGYSIAKLSAAGAAHQITFILNMRDWAVRKKKR